MSRSPSSRPSPRGEGDTMSVVGLNGYLKSAGSTIGEGEELAAGCVCFLQGRVSHKVRQPFFRGRMKDGRLAMPIEAHFGGVEGVVREEQAPPLFRRQAVLHQGEVKVFIAAVELVADDGMA